MFLIPFPQKLVKKTGVFRITQEAAILLDSSCDYGDFEAARLLRQEIAAVTGMRLDIMKGSTALNRLPGSSSGLIILVREPAEEARTNAVPLSADGNDGRKTPPSYRLTVGEGMVIITGASGTGLLYGVQTLRQLVRSNSSILPCVEIEDRPDFENRGLFYDTTRGKVPGLETLMELADRISFYKINQLQLYVEHSFAFRKHSEIWIDSDPLTAEDILTLDEYCRKRGIELVPSISTFGHLYHLLTSKSYKHLNEYENIPDSAFTWVDRMHHYTLDVSNPQSIELICEMIDEYLPLFSSCKFNIGCDETFDLGKGKNKALLEEVGSGKLYVYFVNKIIKHVKSRGKTVMMWGDILLKYPEVLQDLPKDIILLNWGYSPEVNEDGTRTIAEAGLTQYACPGVQGWNKLINRMDDANANIRAMVSHANKYHAQGILNTDWGDFGNINLFAGSIPGIIYGAGLSWNAGRSEGPTDEEISQLEYGDQSGRLIGLIRELSRQTVLDWETIVLWYYSTTGSNVEAYGYSNYYLQLMLNSGEVRIRSAYTRIRELQNEIAALNRGVFSDRKQDINEFQVSAEGLALSQALLLVIKSRFLGQKDTGMIFTPQELAQKLEYWFTDYKKVWRDRNRESELYRIKEVIMGICRLLRG
jgi:hypothetical protein